VSDIKLFQLTSGVATELQGKSVTIEKVLQGIIERNLEACLGVRLLQSEYSTGPVHRGRIDSLGLDENDSPVIIEYKRSTNENVISQGLFYLDWLLDHRAEFTMLVNRVLGPDAGEKIDWSGPRLVCIAGNYTRYDEHAVNQINRNIELMRYRHYEEGFLVLELINTRTSSADLSLAPESSRADTAAPSSRKTVADQLARADETMRAMYLAIEEHLLALGEDVTKTVLSRHVAFRRIKNFATIEIHVHEVLVFVTIDPSSVRLEEGFTRDVERLRYTGGRKVEIRMRGPEDLIKAAPMLLASYEMN
jgi:predicted transport protein